MAGINITMSLTDKVTPALKNIAKQLDKVQKGMDALSKEGNQVSASTTKTSKNLNQVSTSASKASKDLNKVSSSTSKASKDLKKVSTSSDKTSKDLNKVSTSSDKTSEKLNKVGSSSNKASKDLNKVSASSSKTSKDLNKTGTSSNKTSQDLNKVSTSSAKTSTNLNKVGNSTSNASKDLNKVGTVSIKTARDLNKVSSSTAKAGKKLSEVGTKTSKTSKILKQVEATAAKVPNIMSRLGASASKAATGVSKMNKEAQKSPSLFSRLGSSVSRAIGIISGLSIVQSVMSMLSNSVQGALDRIDTMDTFQRKMALITGSTDDATFAMDALKKSTKGTAYRLDTAAQSVQNFVTRGMKTEDAVESVNTWMDVVAAFGKGTNAEFNSATDAVAKMRTKGTVEMRQLNRLFAIGINPVQAYAKATGKSAKEVQDALTNKDISAEKFLNVVEKAYREGTNGVVNVTGMALKAGSTWSGTIENMGAAVTRGMVELINGLDEAFKVFNDNGLKGVVKDFGVAMEDVLTKVGEVAKTFLPPLFRMFKLIGSTINTFVIKPFVYVKDTLKSILGSDLVHSIEAFRGVVQSNFKRWVPESIAETGRVFKRVFNDSVVPLLRAVARVINTTVNSLILPVLTALSRFFVDTFANKLLPAVQQFANKFETSLLNKTVPALNKFASSLKEKLQNETLPAVLSFGDKIVNKISYLYKVSKEPLFQGWKKAISNISDLWTVIKSIDFSKLMGAKDVFSGWNPGKQIGKFLVYITNLAKITIPPILVTGAKLIGRLNQAFQDLSPHVVKVMDAIQDFALWLSRFVVPPVFNFLIKTFNLLSDTVIDLAENSLIKLLDRWAEIKGEMQSSEFVEKLAKGLDDLYTKLVQFRLDIAPGLSQLPDVFVHLMDAVKDIAGKVAPIISKVVGALMKFGSIVIPPVFNGLVDFLDFLAQNGTPVVAAVTGIIGGLFLFKNIGFITPIFTVFGKTITFIVGLLARMRGAFLSSGNVIAGTFAAAKSPLASFGGLFKNLGMAIFSVINPIQLAIGAIVLLVGATAGLMAFGVTIDQVGSFFDGLNERITNAATWLQDGMNSITNTVTSHTSEIASAFGNFGGMAGNLLSNVVNTLINIVGNAGNIVITFVTNVAQMLPTLVSAGMSLIGNFVLGIVQNLPKIFETAVTTVIGWAQMIGQNLPTIMTSGMQVLVNFVTGLIYYIPKVAQAAFQAIGSFLSTIWEHLPDILSAGWGLITGFVSGIVQNIPKIVEVIGMIAGLVLKGIWELIKGLGNLVANAGRSLGSFIESLFKKETWQNIMNGLWSIWNDHVLPWIQSLPGKLWEAAIGLGKSFLKGITFGFLGSDSGIEGTGDAVKNETDKINDAVDSVKQADDPFKYITPEDATGMDSKYFDHLMQGYSDLVPREGTDYTPFTYEGADLTQMTKDVKAMSELQKADLPAAEGTLASMQSTIQNVYPQMDTTKLQNQIPADLTQQVNPQYNPYQQQVALASLNQPVNSELKTKDLKQTITPEVTTTGLITPQVDTNKVTQSLGQDLSKQVGATTADASKTITDNLSQLPGQTQTIGAQIGQNLSAGAQGGASEITSLTQNVQGQLSGLNAQGTEIGSGFTDSVRQGIMQKSPETIGQAASVAQQTTNTFTGTAEKGQAAGSEFMTGFNAGIQSKLQQTYSIVNGVAQQIVTNLKACLNGFSEQDTDAISAAMTKLMETVSARVNTLSEQMRASMQAVKDSTQATLVEMLNNVLSQFTTMAEQTGEQTMNMRLSVRISNLSMQQEMASVIDNITQFWLSKISYLKDTTNLRFSEITDSLKDTLNMLPDFMFDVGQHMIDGLAEGLEAKREELLIKTGSIVDEFKDVFLNGLEIHSPSRFGTYVTRMLIAGMVKGKDQDQVTKFYEKIVKDMKDTLTSAHIDRADMVSYLVGHTPELMAKVSALDTSAIKNAELPNLKLKSPVDVGDISGQSDFRKDTGAITYSGDGPVDVFAALSGTIQKAVDKGFGGEVVIDNGNGVQTIYKHLSELAIEPGGTVTRGQPIGKIGTNDRASFLSFEMQNQGEAINPVQLMQDRKQTPADLLDETARYIHSVVQKSGLLENEKIQSFRQEYEQSGTFKKLADFISIVPNTVTNSLVETGIIPKELLEHKESRTGDSEFKKKADIFRATIEGSNLPFITTDMVDLVTNWYEGHYQEQSQTKKENMDAGIKKLFGFAAGTKYVPEDMVALIHEGEAIIPKAENPYSETGGAYLEDLGKEIVKSISTPLMQSQVSLTEPATEPLVQTQVQAPEQTLSQPILQREVPVPEPTVNLKGLTGATSSTNNNDNRSYNDSRTINVHPTIYVQNNEQAELSGQSIVRELHKIFENDFNTMTGV